MTGCRRAGRAIALLAAAAALASAWGSGPVAGAPADGRPVVVAAENFYGDIVEQIAGDRASVASIINAPNVDPHEYETNARDGAAVARARLVVMNGLGYDDFMYRLMKASPNPGRTVIVVGLLLGHRTGDNAHVWYDPRAMLRAAEAAADALARIDPAGARSYRERLAAFRRSLRPLDDAIAGIRARYRGAPIALTEPAFAYMAGALGLRVITPASFQRAIEQGNEPPASAMARTDDQLRMHEAKVLVYNVQTVTPITARMRRRAEEFGIPVVGVSETEPRGTRYQQWMVEQLARLEAALAQAAK